MKKAYFAQVGLTVAASILMFALVNESMGSSGPVAVQNVRNVGGSVSVSSWQLSTFTSRSNLVSPDIRLPVIPSPTPGASEQVKKECSEAFVAALAYGSAVNKCNRDLTAEYNALTVPKLQEFAVKIGLSNTDVLDPTKVAAAIKAKCERDSAELKATLDTALAECKAAQSNKDSVCGGISKALTAQKKRRDELKAELAKVEAMIAANEKEKSDNGCK